MSRKYINNLMNGVFTPANYSEARFKKKVKAVEVLARQLTKEDPDVGYLPNEDYLYPKPIVTGKHTIHQIVNIFSRHFLFF